MKTEELFKRVEAMGFEVEKDEPLKIITISLEDIFVAKIHYDSDLSFTTEWVAFDDLSYKDKLRLYNLIDEYARTPVPDREVQDAYTYQLAFVDGRRRYVNYNVVSHDILIGTDAEDGVLKTRFTDAYIKSKPRLKDFIDRYTGLFIRVKVDADPLDNEKER